jgi:MoaA/NifB/PqqE/SkfB family radical SAM enzyme
MVDSLSQTITPERLEIEVTERCPLNCIHCSVMASANRTSDLIQKMQRVQDVNIEFGGVVYGLSHACSIGKKL